MNPFAFLESINTSKQHLMDEDPLCERSYNSFLVNRGLSYFADTVFFANAMNTSSADNRMQYDYMFHSIRRKTRRSKWHKPENDERIVAIKQLYGYSTRQAKQALKILNFQQIQSILDEYRHCDGK